MGAAIEKDGSAFALFREVALAAVRHSAYDDDGMR